MKKTFLVRRNAVLSSGNLSWGLVALLFAGLLFLIRFLAPNIFWSLATPVLRVAGTVGFESQSLVAPFENAHTLAIRNEQLTTDNALLASENETLSQKLAAVTGLSSASSSQTAPGILAGVLARPPESPYDTLLVSAGSSTGVSKGMEAFGEGEVPLGVVSAVFKNVSRVTVFSSPGMTTQGWIGHGSVPATIIGAGGGAMNIVLPRSANIVVGDTVFVPGPGMLPVGTVSQIDSDPSSPSVTVHVLPVLNLFSVTWIKIRDTGTTFLNQAVATSSPV